MTVFYIFLKIQAFRVKKIHLKIYMGKIVLSGCLQNMIRLQLPVKDQRSANSINLLNPQLSFILPLDTRKGKFMSESTRILYTFHTHFMLLHYRRKKYICGEKTN